MQLLVKTLKGEKFQVEVEETQTFAQVKTAIESTKSELPAASLKLIHSGKVLKDDATVGSAGIKPKDFLVVMVTKAKRQQPKPENKPEAAGSTPAAAAAAPSAADVTAASTPAAAAPETPAPAASAASSTPPAAPAQDSSSSNISADAVANLVAMGFPEAEVNHCLRAAHGNPDVAVEFLTNGIPDGVAEAAAAMAAASPMAAAATGATAGAAGSTGEPLQGLRNHPQFNALRRMVQSNPQMLQQILTQIGQQQPDLLAEINANQALFLQIMNEPITDTAPAAGAASGGGADAGSPAAAGGGAGSMGAMMDGAGSPVQMAQMIQGMSGEELNQMAAMMGLSPDQLRQTAQMIGQMPPEQLQQFMMQTMGGGMGDFGGAGAGGGGGAPPGQTVLRLTEEEMAAVDRLAAMGFDRSEAAQAFLACDKNEQLAANLLMDSMGGGGGAFGFDDGANGGGDASGGGGNDGDDMYD